MALCIKVTTNSKRMCTVCLQSCIIAAFSECYRKENDKPHPHLTSTFISLNGTIQWCCQGSVDNIHIPCTCICILVLSKTEVPRGRGNKGRGGGKLECENVTEFSPFWHYFLVRQGEGWNPPLHYMGRGGGGGGGEYFIMPQQWQWNSFFTVIMYIECIWCLP